MSTDIDYTYVSDVSDIEVGEKFDPNIHQAMMEIPKEDLDPGLVCEILQNGYKIYDRLLRPAMVGVSKSKQDQKSDD